MHIPKYEDGGQSAQQTENHAEEHQPRAFKVQGKRPPNHQGQIDEKDQRVSGFRRHVEQDCALEVLDSGRQFTFFRSLLNYDQYRIAGKPKASSYLDYQVVNSNIEVERDHLRVGDHFIRALTMKEAISETRP